MSTLTYDPEAARAHLREADVRMAALLARSGPFELTLRGEPFAALARSILFQQLAGPAALAIERRFLALFEGRYPEPHELAAVDGEALRGVGLSRQKAASLADLAAKALDGTLALDRLAMLEDEEVLDHVTQVRGIGRWTGEMLLIFSLGRPDVLPLDDHGVRRATQQLYELPDLPKKAELLAIGEAWRPYRSVASWYLWKSLGGPA